MANDWHSRRDIWAVVPVKEFARAKQRLAAIDLRGQMQNIAYTVGQWQNGFFRSIAGVGLAQSELVAPRVKTGWA